MSDIEWRDIPGFDGYMIGSDGTVVSYKRKQPFTRSKKVTKHGYAEVILTKDGKQYDKLVHRLVLEAFVGPCPPGMECCHGPDPDKLNNHVSNLRWGTRKENGHDKVLHGTVATGERHGQSKLTAQDVRQIRAHRGFITGISLATTFGVSSALVSYIQHGKAWRAA